MPPSGWEYEQTSSGQHLPVYNLADWQSPQQFRRRMGWEEESEEPRVRQEGNPYVMDSRIKI